MWRPAIAAIVAVSASGQTAALNPFAKAPANVDEALKSRVNEFYQDHVTGKYRRAEALVAEESKDGFYAATKPAIEGFTIGDIVYSEKYTKAKVKLDAKMLISFLGMSAPKLMVVPIPSYWKVENGKWVWYISYDRNTPFGEVKAKKEGGNGVDPAQAFRDAPSLAAIQSGVKVDKAEVSLPKAAGTKAVVTLTNELQGPVSVSLDMSTYPGMLVTLDPREIKAGQKAVLTLESAAAKSYANRIVRVVVKPSNQLIDVMVKFQ